MGYYNHLFICDKCNYQVLYTSYQLNPKLTHICKPKPRKQMVQSDFNMMNKILHENGCKVLKGDQFEYWQKRVSERIKFIQPAIDELKEKGIDLISLCKELHEEWFELIEAKNYYNF